MSAVAGCVLTEAAWQRAALEEVQRLRIFGDVPEAELACLVARATEDHMPAGTKIVDESEHFDTFLILLEGTVRVSRSDGQGHFLANKVISAPAFMG